MKNVKMDRKTRYTRMMLQDSLVELMKDKPITKITIKELCEKADINRSTFYAHYNDQHDLLRNIQEETLSWVSEAVDSVFGKTDKNGITEAIEKICQYLVENSRHLQVLMSEQGDLNFQKELFTLIYKYCGMSPLSNINTGTEISEDYFVFVVNGSVGLIRNWLKNGFTKNAKEMAETIYNFAIAIR